LLNRVLGALGLFARFFAIPVVAAWISGMVPRTLLANVALSPMILALLVFVITDFANYCIHGYTTTIVFYGRFTRPTTVRLS
jgi:hypothetical protein